MRRIGSETLQLLPPIPPALVLPQRPNALQALPVGGGAVAENCGAEADCADRRRVSAGVAVRYDASAAGSARLLSAECVAAAVQAAVLTDRVRYLIRSRRLARELSGGR